MAKYTNRTCHDCGIRLPQPEMVQNEIYTEVGKSKRGISGATVAGVFLENKRSANAFNDWLFNNSQRTYKRKRKVWLCRSCAKRSKNKNDSMSTAQVTVLLIIIAVLFLIFTP